MIIKINDKPISALFESLIKDKASQNMSESKLHFRRQNENCMVNYGVVLIDDISILGVFQFLP